MLKKLHFKSLLLMAAMLAGGSNFALAKSYAELFTITSSQVVSGSGYKSHTATVSDRGFVITFGGNNKSVGTNSTNRSSCKLSGTNAKYAVSPVTASSIASAFANTTSVSGVSKISYTFNGGSNQTNTNVYLLHSSDNTTFSQVALTSGTQGAAIASGTEYEFDELSGYFALLFVATNSSGNWRIDDVSITYYKNDVPDAPTFSHPGGEFNAPFDLTITGATGTTLKYTTDGSAPSGGVAVDSNTKTITIAATTRVRAIAIKDGESSKETDVTYTYVTKSEPTFSLSATTLNMKVNEVGVITLTTNSDGAIAFSCDNAHVSIDAEDNHASVSADAEGVYTVDVNLATSSTYMSKEGTVTLNVTKYDTSVAIDASGITNTDLKDGTAAGTITAAVTYGSSSAVPEASVTWSSSNQGVAKVNETTGVVTLVGAGNTTITATYAGTAAFNESSDTYVLTVTDTRNSFTWDLSTNSYVGTVSEDLITWTNVRAEMKNEKGNGTKVNNYIPTTRTSTRFYSNNTLTITPASVYRINSVEFTATSTGYATALKNSSWVNATATSQGSKVYVTPTDGTLAFSARIGDTCGFTAVKVYYDPIITISSAGMATYCSADALDFTDLADIDVYKATVEGTTINFTRIKKVPANTGVLLRNSTGKKAAVAVVPVLSGAADNVEGNLFVAATEEIEHLASSADGYNNYILNNGTNGLGFYLANNQKVGAGKAYLHVPESTAKGFITFDDATGIELVNNASDMNTAIYNLQGQRVSEGYKGVVIVNGKKIIK